MFSSNPFNFVLGRRTTAPARDVEMNDGPAIPQDEEMQDVPRDAGGHDTVMSAVTPTPSTSNPSRQFSFQPPAQPRSGHSQACLSPAAIQHASDRTSVMSAIAPAITSLTSNPPWQFLSQPPVTATQQQVVSSPVATTRPALHTGNNHDNLAERKSNTPARPYSPVHFQRRRGRDDSPDQDPPGPSRTVNRNENVRKYHCQM